MGYFDFPHTRNYDGDLGWLICEFKKLLAKVEDLEAQVAALNKLYETIPDVIQSAIDAEIAKMEALLEAEIAKMEAALNAQLEHVNYLLQQYEVRFDTIVKLVNEMDQHIADVKAFAQQIYANSILYTDAEIAEVYRYLEWRLDNLIKEWPLVIDPSDGRREDLQTCLNHLYQVWAPGIKVEVFDGLLIPVETLDAMKIPVEEFDRDAQNIFLHRRYAYMVSPFTGEYVPISEVVNMLYDLHRHGVTVSEFDEAQIPVEMMDNAEVEVVTFGTTRKWFDDLKNAM